ncbi:CPBP family intramembrane glutamic endopeptidase [Winogradskyella sp. PE311]|uniref:CPBP family intramembrane glutamic endopeptidase n=1 Tax=Winogradskyella sp. PE311 TaxID=3366943 RepID=UPI0039805AA7
MNYIQQTYNVLHDGWRYLVGTIIIFSFWQIIGAIPLMIALGIKMANGTSLADATDITQMSSLLGKNLFLFLMLITFVSGLLGVILSSKVLHKQSFLHLTTARKKIDWNRFWFIFIIWGIFSVGTTFLSFYLAPEDYVYNLNVQPFIILCIIVILFIPLQTSFEEYLFRGYLMQGIGVLVKNRWVPLLITSIGFGLLHGFNPEVDKLGPIMMVFYIGTGLVLGIMTLMDDGLELALGFHAANNMFTALLVTSDWSALQTDALLTYTADPEKMAVSEIVLPVLIVYPLLLLLLSKKYGWTNWKDKLFGKVTPPPKEDYKIIE